MSTKGEQEPYRTDTGLGVPILMATPCEVEHAASEKSKLEADLRAMHKDT